MSSSSNSTSSPCKSKVEVEVEIVDSDILGACVTYKKKNDNAKLFVENRCGIIQVSEMLIKCMCVCMCAV